jgi:hypothetical protein
MSAAIGLFGMIFGAALVYTLQRSRLEQLEQELNISRKTLGEQAQIQEARIHDRIQALQIEHHREMKELVEKAAALTQDYESKLKQLQTVHQREMKQLIQTQLDELNQFDQSPIGRQPLFEAMPLASDSAELPVSPAEPNQPVFAPVPPSEAPSPESLSPQAIAPPPSTLSLSFKSPLTVARLQTQMQSSSRETRTRAAVALGQLATRQRSQSSAAIALLDKLSRDPEAIVRQSAIVALGQIKSRKALPILKLALRDCNSAVVRAANEAIAPLKVSRTTSTKLSSAKPKRSNPL